MLHSLASCTKKVMHHLYHVTACTELARPRTVTIHQSNQVTILIRDLAYASISISLDANEKDIGSRCRRVGAPREGSGSFGRVQNLWCQILLQMVVLHCLWIGAKNNLSKDLALRDPESANTVLLISSKLPAMRSETGRL